MPQKNSAHKPDPDVHLLPTPPKGWPVHWIQGGKDMERPENEIVMAATVTTVEGPGRVEVFVMPGNGQKGYYRKGALHASDPIWARRRPDDVNNGAWQFINGLEPPDKYKVHNDFLQRQKAQRDAAAKRKAEQEVRAAERRRALELSKQQPANA